MKVIITICLFSVCSNINTYSQSISFPTENATWCYSGYGDTGENFGIDCFYTDGQVNIGDYIYTLVKHKSHPYSVSENMFYREENGKVYVIPQDSTEEIIIYDFNLEVDDVFEVNWAWAGKIPFNVKVKEIEVITTLDGLARKKFTLEGVDDYYFGQWIEGIGDAIWPFLMPAYSLSVSGGYSFSCFRVNEEIIYPLDASPSSCGLSSNSKLIQETVKVYPNPFEDELFLEFPSNDFDKIEILNPIGQIIFSQKKKDFNNKINIPASSPRGIYFIRFYHQEAYSIVQKIVKE